MAAGVIGVGAIANDGLSREIIIRVNQTIPSSAGIITEVPSQLMSDNLQNSHCTRANIYYSTTNNLLEHAHALLE